MIVPTLETERLRLRGHTYDDLGACAEMWSDPGVTRFIGGKPSTVQQTWMRLLAYIGHWSLLGFGYWVVEERESRAFAGEIGFADFKREIAPPMDGRPELGFALKPACHGKGYATEAVRAVVAWGDVHLHCRETVCLIDPRNIASLRVAEKCGYELFAQSALSGQLVSFLSRATPVF